MNQMVLLICLCVNLMLVTSPSFSPRISLNPYFQINYVDFTNLTSSGNIYTQSGIVNYATALTRVNLMDPLIGIVEIELPTNETYLYFDIDIISNNSTSFSYFTTVKSQNNVFKLKFNYMVADKDYNNKLCIFNILFTNPSNGTQLITNLPTTCNGMILNPYSITQLARFLYSVNYDDINNENNILLSSLFLNSTSVRHVITTKSATMSINSVRFSILIFDRQGILQQTNYQTIFSLANTASTSQTNFIYSASRPYISVSNFAGLFHFNLKPSSQKIDIQTTISWSFNVTRYSLNISQMDYDYIWMSQLNVIDYIDCMNASNPSGFYYLMMSTVKCDDVCNSSSFIRNTTFCYACNNSCLTCLNETNCTSCISNYILSPNAKCLPCAFGCSSCLNLAVCLNCVGGYYLNSFYHTCQLDCGLRFYNTASFRCQYCHYSCQDCSNPTVGGCTQCSSADDKRTLVNNSCIPIDGYYESNTTVALQCQSQCAKCSNLTWCTGCIDGYYLSVYNTCEECHITVGCIRCMNLSYCQACLSGYTLNVVSHLCQCSGFKCAACGGVPIVCTQCSQGLTLVNGLCVGACGDGVFTIGEECDYLDVEYGCSKQCKQQNGFNCTTIVGNVFNKTLCQYVNHFTLEIIKIQKSEYQNQFSIKLKISPLFSTLQNININTLISLNISASTKHIGFNYLTGEIVIVLGYNQTIQDSNTQIRFHPIDSGMFRITPTSQIQFTLSSYNNLALYPYTQSTYQMALVMSNFSLTIAILGWFITIISLFLNKLIGVELMGVIQISFFGLISIKNLNPIFEGLINLRYSNGCIQMLGRDALVNDLVPIQARGMYLFSDFILNYNMMFITSIVVMIVGLGLRVKNILSKSEKLQQISRMIIWEYGFTCLMVGGYSMGVSMAMQIIYGVKMNGGITYVSMLEMVILIGIWIVYFVMLILHPQYFGEYTEKLKWSIVVGYYNLLMVERIVLGIVLVLLMKMEYQPMIPIGLMVCQLVVVVVKRHYVPRFHNWRVVVNLIITVGVLAIYQFSILQGQQYDNIWGYRFPIIVCLMLLVCVVYNFVFLIYQSYVTNQQIKHKNKLIQQQNKQRMLMLTQKTLIRELMTPGSTPISLEGNNQKQQKQQKQHELKFMEDPSENIIFGKVDEEQIDVQFIWKQYDDIK